MNDAAKLRWRCRRGMKELDELLLRYLERQYADASDEERRLFAQVLELQDPELFRYLAGRESPEDAALAGVIRKIRGFAEP